MFRFLLFWYILTTATKYTADGFPQQIVTQTQQSAVPPICYFVDGQEHKGRVPCTLHFFPYNIPTATPRIMYRSGNIQDGFNDPGSAARFNVHLYLDHMWHLNFGFSK